MFLALSALLLAVTACGGASPPPEATYRLSSPQVPGWVTYVRISGDLTNSVILTHMSGEVRELRVQRVNTRNVGTQFCESFGLARGLSASAKVDAETGGYVFNFPDVVGQRETYAANVVVDFCGKRSWDRVYYLGFWFGPDAGFAQALTFLKAKSADALQVTPP